MKLIRLHFAFITIILFATSCSKNDSINIQHLNGTYSGKFTYVNTNPSVYYATVKADISVTMADQKYNTTSPLGNFPAAAKGSYTISNGEVAYVDSTVHTANFDWNMILNGSYIFTTKGDSLYLSKKIGYEVYAYRLKKQ